MKIFEQLFLIETSLSDSNMSGCLLIVMGAMLS